jgi:preprotein translocase subunit YajC
VSTGATTEVRFTNRSTVGTLKICKVAGLGISAGMSFTFTISGTTARTVTIAAGSCELVQSIPEGAIQVTETLPSGVAVSVISCNPACDQIDPKNANAQLTIVGGTTSEVDVTNVGTVGRVRICKNAGTGITQGDQYTFTVTLGSQAPFDVQVTAGGLCTTVKNIPDGTTVHIAEQLAPSFRVSWVACDPGCTNIDLNAGTVDLTAAANVEKSVTYTNETNLGSVRICKNAGTGINTGDPFTFTVTIGTQTPFDVVVTAGGLCATVKDIPDGTTVHIAEQLAPSFRVPLVACDPGCTSIDLNAGTVDIAASRGVEKSVAFTNETT